MVGISGASGAIYGIRLLEALRSIDDVVTHLIVTPAARLTIQLETDWSIDAVEALADVVYGCDEIDAAVASGSFRTWGMVIAPCSIKTAGMVANSISDNLLIRAADVTLKERRKLVLMVRECPLHLGHVRTMESLLLMGAVVFPPVPAFYHRPQSLDDVISHTVGRVLDVLGVSNSLSKEWGKPAVAQM